MNLIGRVDVVLVDGLPRYALRGVVPIASTAVNMYVEATPRR